MNFFKAIFGSEESPSKENFPWKPLQELGQLDQLLEESKKRHVLIFKHSTRCGISKFSLRSFESEFKVDEVTIDLYLLDLLKNRALSDAIATRFNVVHQSPQVLLLRNAAVVYTESHGQISAEEIQNRIEKG